MHYDCNVKLEEKNKQNSVHGTNLIIPLACKLNSKQLLCKTLNSRMNIKKVTKVLTYISTNSS